MVHHKKFRQKLSKTKKKRKQRQRVVEKRPINETPKEETKELKKLKEESMPSLEKIKFGRKAREDAESLCNSDEELYSGTIMICKTPISLNYSTTSLNLLAFCNSREIEESLVKEKQPITY